MIPKNFWHHEMDCLSDLALAAGPLKQGRLNGIRRSPIDVGNVEVRCGKGVLTLKVSKDDEAKLRRIAVMA